MRGRHLVPLFSLSYFFELLSKINAPSPSPNQYTIINHTRPHTQVDRIVDVENDVEYPLVLDDSVDLKAIETDPLTMDRQDPDYEIHFGRKFLVKWINVNYSELTWESERDLLRAEIEYLSHCEKFLQRRMKPCKKKWTTSVKSEVEEKAAYAKKFLTRDKEVAKERREEYEEDLCGKIYKNGGQVRDYQAAGISWMFINYLNPRITGGMLADEMGLGKTVQTVAFFDEVRNTTHSRRPFLVVAPLSTIGHWQREFESWSDFNAVVYLGNQEDRDTIRLHELAFDEDTVDHAGNGGELRNVHLLKEHTYSTDRVSADGRSRKRFSEKLWKFDVLICTPESFSGNDDDLRQVRLLRDGK